MGKVIDLEAYKKWKKDKMKKITSSPARYYGDYKIRPHNNPIAQYDFAVEMQQQDVEALWYYFFPDFDW